MSYYIIPNIEEEPEFARIDGPYRNREEVIEALALIANAGVFDTKKEAKDYLDY